MTYFPDGVPYTYGKDSVPAEWFRENLLDPFGGKLVCAGWLDAKYPVRTGEPPPRFVEKLAWLCVNDLHAGMRGFHSCNLCPPGSSWVNVLRDGRKHLLGTAEIRVRTPHFTYAAPNLVLHYVVDHHYLPPDDFVEGVLAAPESNRLDDWSFFRGPYW